MPFSTQNNHCVAPNPSSRSPDSSTFLPDARMHFCGVMLGLVMSLRCWLAVACRPGGGGAGQGDAAPGAPVLFRALRPARQRQERRHEGRAHAATRPGTAQPAPVSLCNAPGHNTGPRITRPGTAQGPVSLWYRCSRPLPATVPDDETIVSIVAGLAFGGCCPPRQPSFAACRGGGRIGVSARHAAVRAAARRTAPWRRTAPRKGGGAFGIDAHHRVQGTRW